MGRGVSLRPLRGTLCSVLFVLFARGNGWDCADKDEIVTEMSKDADLPSECVLTCTALTYREILHAQEKLTVRFRDSEPGESGEFCWFIQRRCGDEAFVLLPVNESLLNGETVELQSSSQTLINSHRTPSIIPDDCGLRFDVTQHLNQQQQQTLCVKLTPPPKGILGESLRCPPFLVTVRKK